MRTETVSLSGVWRFEPTADGEPGDVVVPSQWSHGACWGYPVAWAQVEEAWLSRSVSVPAAWTGRQIRLVFDAVMLKAEVYADDQRLGEHTGGFTPFAFDVSPFAGRTFALRVKVSSVKSVMPDDETYTHPVSYNANKEEGPIARGIWQPVRLEARPAVHIADWHCRTSVRANQVHCAATVSNAASCAFQGRLRARLASGDAFLATTPVEIPPGGEATVAWRRPLDALPLWSHRQPTLLDVTFELEDGNGSCVHALPVKIGLREFRIEGDRFLLNEQPVHLLGFSLVRQRVSPHVWRRDYLRLYLAQMKSLGFNAVRTHACIAPPVVYDVADEVGLLVESQSSIWSNPEPRYWAAGETFMRNALAEQAAWIARDRNHPSIVLWDVENEMVRINPRQQAHTRRLMDAVRALDPSRPVLASGACAFEDADVYHVHSEQRLDCVVRGWQRAGRRKPLISGEWWADHTEYGLACIQLAEGLAGRLRYPWDFRCQADIDVGLGRLFADAIREQRLQGLSGTFPFALEMYLFDPPFAGAQRLDVQAAPDDPVSFVYAEDYHHTEWVSVRHPHVNPGWDPTRPAAIVNRNFASPVTESLQPVIAGFLDTSESVSPGRVRRVLTVVNDGEDVLDGLWQIEGDGLVVAQAMVRVAPGTVRDEPVELTIPSAWTGRRVELRATRIGFPPARLGAVKVFAAAPPACTEPGRVWVTGVAEEIADTLRGLDVTVHDCPTDVPATGDVWLIGAAGVLDRQAVMAWLAQGGTILLLRQEAMPEWLPAAVGFEESRRIVAESLRPFGFEEPLSRAQSGVRRVPILAPGYPLFAGLPEARMLGPWAAGDGRVVDDVFLKSRGPMGGCLTTLAGGRTTDAIALAELPVGAGRVLLCQLRLQENVAHDPEAAHLLRNLIEYCAVPPIRNAAVETNAEPLQRRLKEAWGVEANVPGAIISGGPRVRLVTGRQACSSFARALRGRDAVLIEELQGGLEVLCLLDSDDPSDPAWSLQPLPPDAIFSFVARPRVLHGMTHDDLRQVVGDGGRLGVLPLEAAGSPWQDAILAFAHRKASPKAGASVDGVLGSVVKFLRCGRGGVLVAPEGLLNPGMLSRLGVALDASRLHVFRDHARTSVVNSPALPLDGDYWKWACLETDKNLRPWSRSEPLVLRPRTGRAVADPRTHGAIGYLMWNETYLYAAGISVAPYHAFGQSRFAYQTSCLELFVGPTQIVVSRDGEGRPAFYTHGTPLRGGGLQAISSSVTRFERQPGWPDLARLGTAASPELGACVFELAVPWKILEVAPPTAGKTLPIALAVGFADPQRHGVTAHQLVAPAGFQYEVTSTYMTATFLPGWQTGS